MSVTESDRRATIDRRIDLIGHKVFLALRQSLSEYDQIDPLNFDLGPASAELVSDMKKKLREWWT